MTQTLVVSAIAFLGGVAVGTMYFALLWREANHLTAGGSGLRFVAQFVLRLGLVMAGLGLLFWTGTGAVALLAAGLGFALARFVATRRAGAPARED